MRPSTEVTTAGTPAEGEGHTETAEALPIRKSKPKLLLQRPLQPCDAETQRVSCHGRHKRRPKYHKRLNLRRPRLSASRSSARQKRYREGEHALRLSRRPSAPCRLKLRANKKASDEFTPPMALDPVPQEICLSFPSRLPEPGNHGDQSQGNSTGSATGCTMGEETRVGVYLASAHDNPTDNYTTELARGYRVAQLLAMQAAGLDIRTSPGHQPRNHVFLHPAVAPRRHGCNRQCMRELCGKVSLLGTTFQLQHLSVFPGRDHLDQSKSRHAKSAWPVVS